MNQPQAAVRAATRQILQLQVQHLLLQIAQLLLLLHSFVVLHVVIATKMQMHVTAILVALQSAVFVFLPAFNHFLVVSVMEMLYVVL